MADQDYNPIQSITPCTIDGTPTGSAVTNLPIPSSYEAKVVDISAPDAGRTEDMAMHKMRVGQSFRADVKWSFPTRSDVATLMSAFNSEYFLASVIDPRVATGYVSLRCYAGDRTAPLWNSYHGRWETFALAIIQQNADTV